MMRVATILVVAFFVLIDSRIAWSWSGDGHRTVGAIADLASSLDMTTIAEGVETPQQFTQVQALGCTEVQGFLFSRPKPAAELVNFLGLKHRPLALTA